MAEMLNVSCGALAQGLLDPPAGVSVVDYDAGRTPAIAIVPPGPTK